MTLALFRQGNDQRSIRPKILAIKLLSIPPEFSRVNATEKCGYLVANYPQILVVGYIYHLVMTNIAMENPS